MRQGRIVEEGLTDRVLDDPRHPYTQLPRRVGARGSELAAVVEGLGQVLTLHLQGGLTLPVLRGEALDVRRGRLRGADRAIWGRQVHADALPAGQLWRRRRLHPLPACRWWHDLARADARLVREIRRTTLGYVSQFLRVIPRVSARDVVAEPLLAWAPARRKPGAVRRPARAAEPAGAPARPAARDLLRRRATAGQPRPRLRAGLPASPAGRTHRQPGPRQPRGRRRPSSPRRRPAAPASSASSTMRRCASAWPTAPTRSCPLDAASAIEPA
jgi:hypothetical protein